MTYDIRWNGDVPYLAEGVGRFATPREAWDSLETSWLLRVERAERDLDRTREILAAIRRAREGAE